MNYLIILFVILCNLALVLFFQPHWMLAIVTSVIPGVVYFAKTENPIIALTIDDTPCADTTLLILDILKQNKIKATFFLISSQILGNEKIVEAIVSDGHELGNHMTEDKPSIKLSPKEFEEDLLKAHSIISRFSETKWMRPASGWYNTKMVKIAKKHNYRIALGSIFPYDTHIRSSWFAINHILFNARLGSIIVLHDGNSRGNRTVKTLAKILPILLARGYQFTTLSQLFSES
ncbi:MAG: chitin deacetylase family protein [Pseudanabaena sp.]|jgi:peptidoglycan/xylan/chitin deacetylase (PgdA/CDA1 family)